MGIKRGFSLIETSIAIVLISLIIVGMLDVFNQGFSCLKQSGEKIAAYNLAQEVIEQLSDWANMPAVGNYKNPSFLTPQFPVTLNNIVYNLDLRIIDQSILPAGTLREIIATVSYNGGDYILSTLKADY